MDSNKLNSLAISKFQEYLQIQSVHPDINYDKCVKFLENYAKDIDLEFNVIYVLPEKPMVIISWIGTNPSEKSIMLNSHMDVVPVDEKQWTYNPFEAKIVEGNIYARGSQDCKCIGIQYLETIRRLKLNSVRLKRSVHVSYACDEETTGVGMQNFVKHAFFKKLNVGFALDEGSSSLQGTIIPLYYAEKHQLCAKFYCNGEASHACLLKNGTSTEKMMRLLNKIYEFRSDEMKKMEDNFDLDHVTSINITMINGGLQANIIPASYEMVMDSRLPPTRNIAEFKKTLEEWCKEAGDDVQMEIFVYNDYDSPTDISDKNLFYVAFKNSMQDMGFKISQSILPAVSDARFLRNIGIPTINFSPLQQVPMRIHSHDEYLPIDIFLQGIDIYYKIILSLGNI